jgi:type IV pilus assembly protein PilV
MRSLRRKYTRGISLIEVMVAILVFGIGIMGLALLQIRGAQFTRDASARTAAVALARSLADSMRANPNGALPADGSDSAYLYDGTTTYTQDQCDSTTLDTPQQIATRDLACWQIALKNSLPAPATGVTLASVAKDTALGTLVITISWAGVSDDSTSVSQSYSFSYLQ